MNPTVKILTAARALIEPPGSWCRCARIKSPNGEIVSRCGLLALWKIRQGDASAILAESILAQVARDRGFDNFVKFNDDPATTHAMVLDAFTDAIEKARADG